VKTVAEAVHSARNHFATRYVAGSRQLRQPNRTDSIAIAPGWNTALAPANTVAQTFTTPNKVERLDYVEIFVSSTNGGTVEAWVKAGAPGTSGISGTDVTATVPAGAENLWIDLIPPTGIILAANSQYSVMFKVTDGTTKVQGNSNGSLYAGGAAYAYDGSAWSTPAGGIGDLSVDILMSPLPGTLDQQQDAHNHSVGYLVMAQTFTAGVGGTLNGVSLWSDGSRGSTEVTVAICSVPDDDPGCIPPVGGVIGRPALDTGVLAVSEEVQIPVGVDQWFDFVFSTPPTIVAGTQYAIVIGANAGWRGSTTDAYTGGSALNGSGGGWNSINGDPVYDLAFQTFVTRSGSSLPPTNTAGASSAPGGSTPAPLFLALVAALPAAGLVLAKRHGIVARP
jgi:hypothetical protein